MLVSSFEVAMQTMGSVVSEYLEDKNCVPVITQDGLNRLVNEQFPHCEKEEISPGIFRIRIPLKETCLGCLQVVLAASLTGEFNAQDYAAWDRFLQCVAEIITEQYR